VAARKEVLTLEQFSEDLEAERREGEGAVALRKAVEADHDPEVTEEVVQPEVSEVEDPQEVTVLQDLEDMVEEPDNNVEVVVMEVNNEEAEAVEDTEAVKDCVLKCSQENHSI